MTEVLLLGSGGWIPTTRRATCSALIRRDGHALLIDAGTGISRLVENNKHLDGVRSTDVVLTHFHLDHIIGLSYLPALPLPEPPRVHGPGEQLYGAPTRDILRRLVGPPLFGLDIDALVSDVREVGEGDFEAGPFRMTARVQRHHNDPTLALRLDDVLAYCTDTSYDEGNTGFAKAARVLFHEAWYTEDAPRSEAHHSSAREAAEIARRAGVGRLVLIHLGPDADEERLGREARSVFEAATVGSDLLRL
jgi:ribonuclease BN (tRNA processing enzyme)